MNRDLFGFRVSEPLSEPDTPVSPQFDLRRIYSALVFVPIFYLLVRHGSSILFFLFVTVVALLCLWEFYQMFLRDRARRILILSGVGVLILVLGGIQWGGIVGFITVPTIIVFGSLIYLMINSTPMKPVFSSSLIFPFGAMYIGLGLGHFLLIRKLTEGDLFVFFVVLVTWAADTAAYFTGVTMGRRQLAPRLSPKKTVEGFVGGLLGAILVACVSHFWFFPFLRVVDCVIIASLLACIGLIGDLAESALKRRSGVKDSGAVIPGHGGVLDRVDSLLFTGPAFYYYVIFTNTQAVL